MKTNFIWLVCMTIILSVKITFGQAPLPPVNASVSITNGQGLCFVELPDSTGWSFIEVELKDMIKDSVLFSREYVFDQTSGLPSGISWSRTGKNVYMGTGTLPDILGWQGRVRIKNTLGQWSNPYEFIFQ